MSWYLTITPAAGETQVADTRQLVEFLAKFPELRQTSPIAFEGAPDRPWVSVVLAKKGPTGRYASDGSYLPTVDIVEMVCSHSGDAGWYDSLAVRIATFLGWMAVEEHENRLVWPLA